MARFDIDTGGYPVQRRAKIACCGFNLPDIRNPLFRGVEFYSKNSTEAVSDEEEEITGFYVPEREHSSESSTSSTAVPMFADKRNFTEEELAKDDEFEPEGADHYEVDEEQSNIHVIVNNFEEIYTHYDDWKICNELPYYLHTYFNLCTGNLDERYVVTLTEGSCVCEEYYSVITWEATVDKYPGMTIYLEYDKQEREFGIKSDLGDYSLQALKEKGSKSDFWIEYDPNLDMEDDGQAGDATAVDPNEH